MKHFRIFIVIIFIAAMASSGCFIPEEPVQEVNLSESPSKPPMDLDKPPPEEVSLIERMGYEDTDVRYAAYDELIAMGKDAVPILVEEGLKHENPAIRNASASTLGKIGPDAADAVPALIEALDDEYSQVKWTAVKSIGMIGPAAIEAIPGLIEKLKINNWMLNHNVAIALARIGDASVPFLIEVLETGDDNAMSWAMESIREMGPAAKDAIGPLIELLRTKSPTDSPSNLWTVRLFMALGADVSVGPLISVLKDENVNGGSRGFVADVLSEFDTEAAEALPVFIELLGSDDSNLNFHCFTAIGSMKVDPELSVSVLSSYLDDEDGFFRGMAAVTIGGFGVAAEGALPKLREILEHDPDKGAREGARISIEQIEFELQQEESEGES